MSFTPDSGRIPLDFGQINLALEDLIPTCVPRNLTESTESSRFWKMRPVRNRKKIWNAQPSPRHEVDAGDDRHHPIYVYELAKVVALNVFLNRLVKLRRVTGKACQALMPGDILIPLVKVM